MPARLRTRTLAFALLSLAAMSPAQADERRTLQHQGVARDVIVINAPAAGAPPRPVLIALHGRREPDAAHRSSPQLDALARKEGFVAVYPSALQGQWNHAGRTGSLSKAGSEPADDIGFMGRLIDWLVAEKIADPARVHVSGTSAGGFMTYSILCLLSDKIAAAAPFLASMTEAQMTPCKPVRVVPMMVIAGTDDRVVPYDGQLTKSGRLTSVPETLEFWRRLMGCTGQHSAAMPHREPGDPTRTLIVDWSGCRQGTALRLYRVEGGGHILPALTPASAEQRWGRRNRDFETSVETWEFFKSQAR